MVSGCELISINAVQKLLKIRGMILLVVFVCDRGNENHVLIQLKIQPIGDLHLSVSNRRNASASPKMEQPMELTSEVLRLDQRIGRSNAPVPINIVTSTYLDRRRSYRYIYIWSYLGVLYIYQIFQYMAIQKKSTEWKNALVKWKQWKEYLLHQKDFQWFPYKEDYLPHSVVFDSFRLNLGCTVGELCRFKDFSTCRHGIFLCDVAKCNND
jgi:hypothetical protein